MYCSNRCNWAIPKAGLDVRHPIVVAQLDLLVATTRRMEDGSSDQGLVVIPWGAQAIHVFSDFRLVGSRHAAFAGGDDLYRMKTENGNITVLAGTNLGTFVTRTDSVGGRSSIILNP